MEKVKKVLVLGSSGMLGHVLVKIIKHNKLFQVSNIARRKTIFNDTLICDVTDFKKLEEKIKKISPDYIVNSVGILINESKMNPKNAILINAYLPHFLESISKKYNFQLIQISTDCVFSGNTGSYQEDSIKDAKNIYGISKGLGEIISTSHLTIRTSIIGPEIKNQPIGLFEWVVKNKNKEIDGFSKSIWSGLTTVELSKAIIYCINNNIKGLLHIASQKISKFELICIINDIFNLGVNVKKVKGEKSDKSLITNREDFLFKVPSHFEMISEMSDFINQN